MLHSPPDSTERTGTVASTPTLWQLPGWQAEEKLLCGQYRPVHKPPKLLRMLRSGSSLWTRVDGGG
jgi:hypothetical protein